NTVVETGLTDRHYFGAAQFDGSLMLRHGVGDLGAQDDTLADGGGPTWHYRMLVADANLSVPFKVGAQPLRYVTTFHGQFTNDHLYSIDAITIGSRYTVRGFDGEMSLIGDRGFYWRNELQLPLGPTGQSLYGGLDYGHVYGPSTVGLAGTQLAGAVIGLRGGWGTRAGSISYDLFLGTPVYKPVAFQTAKVTAGFQLIYQY
ncbi:ShlB/FhaC/HecB family hemolysin secretion/activation protein, partial [Ralstonia solanacearum]